MRKLAETDRHCLPSLNHSFTLDYVILCRGTPQPWFRRLAALLPGLGLPLNAAKTRSVDAAEGLDVLGRHVRRTPMRHKPQRLFGSRWPSTRAMPSLRQKVREAMGYDDL
jgi:hypothetical protein